MSLRDEQNRRIFKGDFWEIDTERFPKGMKYVADYVHSKGLKFGIYSCAGQLTCEVDFK